MTGNGVPGGLPLILRFSGAKGVLNSISQWRTLILVNPALRGVHALSFPFKNVAAPPFGNGQDYTVKIPPANWLAVRST